MIDQPLPPGTPVILTGYRVEQEAAKFVDETRRLYLIRRAPNHNAVWVNGEDVVAATDYAVVPRALLRNLRDVWAGHVDQSASAGWFEALSEAIDALRPFVGEAGVER